MKYINIIAEGSTEETFVNDVLVQHFARMNKFVSVRKIETGWDKANNRPAKGGFGKVPNYTKFQKDISNWIQSDRGKPDTWYTTFVDLYAFPKDPQSPYTASIQKIIDPYQKIKELESNMLKGINHPNFIPYVQLHEFETFILVDPDKLLTMYPDAKRSIQQLKNNIGMTNPEEVNESPQTAPSKRIINFIPDYKDQKAQVGPLVAHDIGLLKLRSKCPHFDEWITKLENL